MNLRIKTPVMTGAGANSRWYCFLLFLAINFLPASGASQRIYVAFDRVLDNQGYTNSIVPAFAQDKYGFIWFGTPNGLCRYDGYKSTVFKQNPHDANSLSNNNVGELYFDKKGILWIGTDDGLNRFDPTTETFTRFFSDPNDPESLSQNEIDVIYSDVLGKLWIGTYLGGVNKFDPETGKSVRFMHNPDDPGSISHNEIRCIIEDTEGNMWFGTAEGLNLLNGQNGKFTRFFHDPKNPNSLCFNNVSVLFQDLEDTIWIGTWGGGINKFYPKENRFEYVPFKVTGKLNSEPIRITFIHQDQSGTLWFGVNDLGLCRYNEQDQSFVCYSNRPDDIRSLSSNRVVSIFEDKSAILWIGTRGGGISKYNPRKEKFYVYKNEPILETNLNKNNQYNKLILAICEDPDDLGNVYWIGSFNSLFRLNREQDTFQQFPNTCDNLKLPGKDVIRSILFDKTKKCWLGTDVGLFQFSRSTGKFTPHDLSWIGVGDQFAINTIISDSLDRIWIGSDEGLLQLDSDYKIKKKLTINKNAKTKEQFKLIHICEQKSSRGQYLWLGAYDSGLIKYSVNDGKTTAFTFQKGHPNSISNNNVRTILEDKSGILWLGTDRGMNRFDPKTEQFQVFSEKDGLCNERVFALVEDDIGRIWISTNNGLSRFDPMTRTFLSYDISHGLELNYFVQGAYLKSWSGEIFLGGVNGYLSFYPHEINANPNIPDVVITDFRVLNKSLKIKDRLEKSIIYTDEIQLTHKDYLFSIEYTALDYNWPEKNRYAYKMEGSGADWIDMGVNREITFSWLESGDYIFKIKGCNSDGVWNESPRELHIKILPPWWKTWWAYSIYISVFCLAILAGHRYRVRQLKNREEILARLVKQRTDELDVAIKSLRDANDMVSVVNDELKESMNELVLANDELRKANELKSEFLGIAAHDLKDPLQVILGYTDLLKRQLIENRISSKEVDSINRSVEKMLKLISKFLDAATFEKKELLIQKADFNFSDLTDSVVRNNRVLAERKQQNIIFFSDARCLVSGDRLLLRQVVENLISNAIKYSPLGKNIWVLLESTPARVVLKVKDEGPGLSKDDQKKLFQKFCILTPKPTGNETSTGLGLSICKRFIELHQGVISAECKLGEGCTFIVDLPKAQTEATPSPQ